MTGAGDSARVHALTNDRLLRRNVALNLAGWALPAVAALLAIPLLASGLGAARFGLVTLAWAIVGLFSLLDFGLGRALTRVVAERLARGRLDDIGALVWSTSWLLLGVTTALAAAGILAVTMIVDRGMHVPPELRAEAVGVVLMLLAALPPLAHGVALRGVLEAGQRFGRVNQLRVPLGIANYAGPLLALPLGGDARWAVGVILAARVLYWLAHFPVLKDVAPGVAAPRRPTRAALDEVMRLGGWIAVSSVVSPIIMQGDRIAVALAFPIAVSGWYGAASEVAIKQWLFSVSLGPVLFSAQSAAVATDLARAVALTMRAARITALVLFPVTLVLVVAAEPGLKLWLGGSYVPESAPVLRWLAIAAYANAIGHSPYFLLQSGVDARAVGILHLAELPVYAAALAMAAAWYGVPGVAFVWLGRMVVDSVFLWVLVIRGAPQARSEGRRVLGLSGACLLALVALALWMAR